MSDAAEKRHMARVASLGCCLCRHLGYGFSPAEVHHIRAGAGMGQRSPHYLTVGLCYEHHRGNSGVHGLGVRGFYTRYKLDELDLLSMTIQLMMETR